MLKHWLILLQIFIFKEDMNIINLKYFTHRFEHMNITHTKQIHNEYGEISFSIIFAHLSDYKSHD